MPTIALNGSYSVNWTAVTGAATYRLQEQVGSGAWAEESQLRLHGGLRRDGGGLVNKRHEMSEQRYRASGGRAGPPLGSRTRR